MHIGLVGLGKMGGNMRTRLRNAGIEVTGFDRNPDVSDAASLQATGRGPAGPPHGMDHGSARRPDHRDRR